MLTKCLLIFLAGGVGSVARFLLSNWGQRQTSGNFPVGTLLVNILGCFAIGFLERIALPCIRVLTISSLQIATLRG